MKKFPSPCDGSNVVDVDHKRKQEAKLSIG